MQLGDLMANKSKSSQLGFKIPQHNTVIPTARGEILQIGTKVYRSYIVLMSPEGPL